MTVVLLRHASAGDREQWQGHDALRPLDERGHEQARLLVELLAAHAPAAIRSSPYVRCAQTVEPLAAALGLAVEPDDRLAEGPPYEDAAALLRDAAAGTVLCTHGDVVFELLGRDLKKGAAALLEPGTLRELGAIPAP